MRRVSFKDDRGSGQVWEDIKFTGSESFESDGVGLGHSWPRFVTVSQHQLSYLVVTENIDFMVHFEFECVIKVMLYITECN